MAGKDLILDSSEYDLNHVIADLEEIRRYNPQRFEMEQLTAIVYEDVTRHICVGYNDLPHDAFWARGHMPGMPLLPGVLMCEAAAQICSYYSQKHDLLGAKILGFGGMDSIRFRDPVLPGDRLVIVSQVTRFRRGAMTISRFQALVRDNIVCEGNIKGVPLPIEQLLKRAALGTLTMFPLYDNIPSTRLPIVTCTIIALNFLVQIWTAFMPVNDATRFEYTYAFIWRIAQLRDDRPIEVPIRLQMQDRDTGQIVEVEKRLEVPADRGAIIMSIFTAMFLHAGWMHLLGNMWFLWIFGDNVEDRLGHFGYAVFYLVGGLFANGCHWLSDPGSGIPVVGASGAIAAVLGAYAITWPHARVHTLIMLVVFITLVDVPAWIMLGFWFLTQVFSVANDSGLHGGVAFWAHIGGFVVGVGMMLLFGRRGEAPPTPNPEIRIMNFPTRN